MRQQAQMLRMCRAVSSGQCQLQQLAVAGGAGAAGEEFAEGALGVADRLSARQQASGVMAMKVELGREVVPREIPPEPRSPRMWVWVELGAAAAGVLAAGAAMVPLREMRQVSFQV